MGDSQVMTRQPLRESCSKFKTDFSDLFDEDEDDRPLPPLPPHTEQSISIRKIRIEGWAKDILEKNDDDDPDPWLGWAKDILEKKKNDDDDPDPSNSRTDIFRVCPPANANPNQDTSASTTYLGNQAGNTNMVEDILVGRSGAGGEKKNLYMKNDDVDRQTDVVVAVKEDIGEDTPPCLSSGWGSLLPPATTHQKQKASVQWRPWTEERQKEIGKDLNHNSTEFPSPPVFASTSPPLTNPKPPGSSKFSFINKTACPPPIVIRRAKKRRRSSGDLSKRRQRRFDFLTSQRTPHIPYTEPEKSRLELGKYYPKFVRIRRDIIKFQHKWGLSCAKLRLGLGNINLVL